MKKLILFALLTIASTVLLIGCHNTGRQIRKTVDGIHDLLLEGTD